MEYTNPQLRELERELLPFLETRTLSTKEVVKVYNFNAFYQSKGIMKYHPESKDWAIYEHKLKEFDELEDKIAQLSKLRSKTAYAKQKEAEEFATQL